MRILHVLSNQFYGNNIAMHCQQCIQKATHTQIEQQLHYTNQNKKLKFRRLKLTEFNFHIDLKLSIHLSYAIENQLLPFCFFL